MKQKEYDTKSFLPMFHRECKVVAETIRSLLPRHKMHND